MKFYITTHTTPMFELNLLLVQITHLPSLCLYLQRPSYLANEILLTQWNEHIQTPVKLLATSPHR